MTRKYGNRSGSHTLPKVEFRAEPDAIALWDLAAEREGATRSDWIRRVLTEGAARELKLDPVKAVEDLGE